MVDEAIILAGGLGTRLRAVVRDVPKPLAPIAGRPFLAWVLDSLVAQRIARVVLATGHLGEQIKAAMGTRWNGIALEYSHEANPLGTGGAVAMAARLIKGDAFFVLNGDTWLQLDYAEFNSQVELACARVGVALAQVQDASRYGAVEVANNRVVGFAEKSRAGSGFINAGVYRVQKSFLNDYPRPCPFSFERDVLVPSACREAVMGYTRTKGFIDIGVPEDYRRAHALFGSERTPG